MTALADLPRDGRPPLLRLLAVARPLRGRLLAAVAAGAAATGCGVALLAVSVWRRAGETSRRRAGSSSAPSGCGIC
jgi:hypothetical protein